MITVIRICSAVLLGVVSLQSLSAEQVDQSKCVRYANAVKGDYLRRELIANWTEALPCLLVVVDGMTNDVNTVQAAQDRKDLLQTTVAIRAILDGNTDQATPSFQSTIKEFGTQRSLDVISVFAFAARTDNHELRVSATPILGYVIDNSTACVPMDHLYDNNITPEGRVNLLAVVSAFALKASEQNVANIKRLIEYMGEKKSEVGPQAKSILESLSSKIFVVGVKPGQGTDADLASCKAYTPRWGKDHLRYP